MSDNPIVRIAIVGIGQRAKAYFRLCKQNPEVKLEAICDISQARMSFFAREYGLPDVPQYTNLEYLFAEHEVDGLVITVPDFAHKSVALTAFKHHCGIMLEKPMAPTANDCRDILRAWQKSGEIMQIGFVLRFHPFYQKLKNLLSAGAIGELTNIEASECMNVMHGASYMRRWHRKSANSGGFLLAKCSHDLDLLNYLTGTHPLKLSSFGALGFFRPEKQRYQYCSQCEDKSCPFRFNGEMVVMTDEEKAHPSEHNFDLCVYNNDKDVVDRQNVILEYPGQIIANFSLNLFAHTGNRFIKLHGTQGTLEGNMNDAIITLTHAIDGREEYFECKATNNSAHGGSDLLFFEEFVSCLKNHTQPPVNANDGLAATVIGNAAEKSRRQHKVVEISAQEYLF